MKVKSDLNSAEAFKDKCMKSFPSVIKNELNDEPMRGTPMKIHLVDEGVVPKRVCVARQVPLHQVKEAEALISDLEKKKIIAPVAVPTDWVSSAFFVPKPNGKVRLVTDYTDLNKYVRRPVHPFPSAREILQNIQADSKVFLKIDAVHGYFQLPLDVESSYLTTFLLPGKGRYRYLRGPMGLSSTNDEWCRRSDAILEGSEGSMKIVDDVIIQAPNYDILWKRAKTVFEKCAELNIAISEKKFECGEKVQFAGFVLSSSGISPDPEKVQGIADFPVPKNTTDIRSFLGMANQLANYLPDLAHNQTKMNSLLKKGVQFLWLPDHQAEFEMIKKLLTSDLVVKPFEVGLRTELLTDASRLHGLGYCLVQWKDGEKRLITCGSCALTDCQTRYAVVELELLAAQYAMKKCRHFLLGCPEFALTVDHKPLLGIFKKDICDIENPRLQNLRMKMTRFNFKANWSAGKEHLIADCLSRHPVFRPKGGSAHVNRVISARTLLLTQKPTCEDLLKHALVDEEYLALLHTLKSGETLDKLHRQHSARKYASVWHSLSIFGEDELILVDGARILIPENFRRILLKKLHVSHSGLTKTWNLASQLYYWPTMKSDIARMIEKCDSCQELRPSQQQEPVIENSDPFAPMSHVALDLFELSGKHFLVMVCRFSGWPFVAELKSLHTAAVTRQIEKWCLEQGFGWPTILRTDNGPQFRSEFSLFCRTNNIVHQTSSPYNSRSNGLAESSVKQMKYLMEKVHDRQ